MADLNDDLYAVLQEHELVSVRQNILKLSAWYDQYIDSKTDVSESRRGKLRNCKQRLLKKFGDCDLRDITQGHTKEYARCLLTIVVNKKTGKTMAQTTAKKCARHPVSCSRRPAK